MKNKMTELWQSIVKFAPQILIGIGMIFTLWGGILTLKRTTNFRDNINTKTDTIKTLGTDNKTINTENQSLLVEVERLGNENIDLSSENQKLLGDVKTLGETNEKIGTDNKELNQIITTQSDIINNHLTSGTSWFRPYITIDQKDNQIKLWGTVQGEYHLHNLWIELKSDNNKIFEARDLTIRTNKAWDITKIPLDKRRINYMFQLSFSANNGDYDSVIRLFYANGKWHQYEVHYTDLYHSNVRVEQYSPNHPNTPDNWKNINNPNAKSKK
jgi:hypothetical protein